MSPSEMIVIVGVCFALLLFAHRLAAQTSRQRGDRR
jgi:hypothetical protein